VYFGDTSKRSGSENARIALDLPLRGFAPFFFSAREVRHTAKVLLREAKKTLELAGGTFDAAMEAIGKYAVSTLRRHITSQKTPAGAFPPRKDPKATHPPLKRTGQLYRSPQYRLVRR